MGARRIRYDRTDMPHQEEFHQAMDPKVYMSSGFGGGKTYSLVMKMFQLMHLNRGCPGGFLSPTYKMYKREIGRAHV